MTITSKLKPFMLALALGVALLGATFNAMADKLHLKDGRVLDGTIVKQDSSFIVFNVNGKDEIFDAADVVKVEKTEAAKPAETAAPAAPAAPQADAPKTEPAKADAPKVITGKPNRVAILNFGPPHSWNSKIEDMVGVVVSAKAFEDAIPLLEKDKVDTVVVRIQSGGGYTVELDRFREVFRKYKQKFRTVAWVESAISCAAMSPWVLSEFYMMPEGNIGGCTEWSGNLNATKGVGLLQILGKMEEISTEAGRDPKLMRSMQIMEPLSYNIDDNGKVTFFQDTTSGKHLLNPDRQVLTLNSNQAVACKFAVAVASTPDELVKAMGLKEVEWAGKDASKYIDDYMLQAHRIDKQVGELALNYRQSLAAAQQLANAANDPRFSTELGKVKQYLAQIKKWVSVNPNFRFHLAQGFGAMLSDEWFEQQEEILRALALRAKEAEDRRRRGR